MQDPEYNSLCQKFIHNHPRAAQIIGPGVSSISLLALMDEYDLNHHGPVMDIVLTRTDGLHVRLHPNRENPYYFRFGRFAGDSRNTGWIKASVDVPEPPPPPAQQLPPPPLHWLDESVDRNSSGDAHPAVTPANDTISSPQEHDLLVASDEQPPTPDSPQRDVEGTISSPQEHDLLAASASSGDAHLAVTPANDTISSPQEHDLRAASDEQPTPDSPSEWQLFSEPTSRHHWW